MQFSILSRFREFAARLERMLRRPEVAAGAADAPVTLRITVGDTRWQAMLMEPGVPSARRAGQSLPDGRERQPPELVREALAAFGESALRRVQTIQLIVEDVSCVLLDNRTSGFPKPDPESLHRFAAQQFALKKATFGHLPFGKSSEHEAERRLFGFIDAQRASEYLYALGDLGSRAVVLAPAGAVLLRRLAESCGEPFAIVSLNGHFTNIVVASPESGTIVHRVVPIGVGTLVEALVAACGISREQILGALSRRDYLLGVPPRPDKAPGPLSHTLTAGILTPLLHDWRDQLEETLEFFSFQRVGGSVGCIFLHGETGCIKGLAGWLHQALGRAVELTDDEVFEGASEVGDRPFLNLLEGGFRRTAIGVRVDRPVAARRFRVPRPALPEALTPLLESVKLRVSVQAFGSVGWRSLSLLAIPVPLVALMLHNQALRASDAEVENLLGHYEQLLQGEARMTEELRQMTEKAEERRERSRSRVAELTAGLTQAMPGTLWLNSLQISLPASEGSGSEANGLLVIDGLVASAEPHPPARVGEYAEGLAADEAVARLFPRIDLTSLVQERDGLGASAVRFRVTGAP